MSHKINICSVAAPVFQAEGYTDGDLTLFHSFPITAFLKAENPVDFLAKASEVRSLSYGTALIAIIWPICQIFLTRSLFCLIQIIFDNKDLESHAATTNEIKECCRDIRVLGRKELRWVVQTPVNNPCSGCTWISCNRYWEGGCFSLSICSQLLSWRSKLRRYLSKKLKVEAKSLQDEIK